MQSIRNCFSAQDWKNYAIYVHALKSTSKTIGAAELSALASALEQAASGGSESELRRLHGDFLARYGRIAACLGALVPADTADTPAEDEVLEFYPDE